MIIQIEQDGIIKTVTPIEYIVESNNESRCISSRLKLMSEDGSLIEITNPSDDILLQLSEWMPQSLQEQRECFNIHPDYLGTPIRINRRDVDNMHPIWMGIRPQQMERPGRIEYYHETDNIYSNKIEEKYKVRKCWACGKALSFSECLDTELNKYYFITHRSADEKKKESIENKVREQLEKQWASDKIEIACCDCYEIIERITKQEIVFIKTSIKHEKWFAFERKEIIKTQKKQPTYITITFNTCLDKEMRLSIRLFKSLVDKKVIDIDPEMARELLGGSE